VTYLTLYLNLLPFIFGTLIGSFLNVVIYRWPRELSVVSPPSACPGCNTPIAWYDNIPLISWTLLGAKCRICKTPISWRYPAIEFLTGFMSWVTFRRFVPDLLQVDQVSILSWVLYFYLVACLIAIVFIDFEHYLIPDILSLPAIPIGILGTWGLNLLGGGLVSVKSAALGAFFGAGVLLLIRGIYQLVRGQEGMGLGDVKMLAMLGAFLGAHPALIFIVFVSSFIGSIVGIGTMVIRREGLQYALPFGPFLAMAALVYLYWGYQFAPLLEGAFFPPAAPSGL
jgi:leader peptidase (prepilin peptidase)/N-methyltransferase